MRLPNPERAVVDAAKVRDYLLSFEHPVGRFKAAVFASVGYSRTSWAVLQADLLASAFLDGANPGRPTPYGQSFRLPAKFKGPSGRLLSVITLWLVHGDEDFPRLVTVYPGGRRWATKSGTR
jgi:hypothetical protein